LHPQAEEEAALDALDDDYHLPINHRPSRSIDMSRCEMATMDRPIPADNIGHRMLLRLGWKVGLAIYTAFVAALTPIKSLYEIRPDLEIQYCIHSCASQPEVNTRTAALVRCFIRRSCSALTQCAFAPQGLVDDGA
jgi:hypothetical protein